MKLQFKQVIAVYVIAALVINPAMAQQQSATLMKQQQFRAIAEKLSVDRQSVSSAVIELATTGNTTDPALKEALNGTTVVDIAAPSAKGVSNNNWNEFNVGEEGIIFNNSAAPVLTQLGGWADGNRRLAGGEASIILNQVTGSNRSTLLGQIEVAGKSAEFILANANGISCNGCGFINTPSVSLITGQSRFAANGDLTFDISGGDFLLEGEGINATNLDRFDIVSRYATLNANLYANNVNLTTGVNEFNYQTKSVTTNSSSTNGNIQFAFDTTALGGMYANKIRLVGTEKGLGINLQGIVQSTQDLEITADGNLQLKQLQANNQIKAESISGSVNTQQLVYAPKVTLNAADTLTNQGFMAAKDDITLSAKRIDQSGDLYAGLNENNQFNSTGALTLTASESLINRGDFYIGGQLHVTTPELNNQGIWLMQSAGTLQADKILNSNSIRLNAQDANLIANSIINSGEILHLGNGVFSSTLTHSFDNTGVFGTNGNLHLTADALNNQGQWFSNDTVLTLNTFNNNNGQFETSALTLNAQTLLNNNGRMLSLGDANTTSALTIAGNIQNQSGVFYTDTGSFTLTTNNLDNTAGNFIINNAANAQVDVNNDLNNANGFFQANQLDINALNLDNVQGDFLTSTLNGTFDTLNNASGFIQADQLSLQGRSLINTGGVVLSGGDAASKLQLIFTDQLLNNQDAVIRNLNGDIDISSADFTNAGGLVDASHNGNIRLQSTQLNNQQGSLIAKNSLQFSGDSVNNTQGYIDTGLVDFTLTGDLTNNQGVMLGGITLSANDFNNDQGYLLIDKNSTIDLTGQLQNQLGVIATQDQLSIDSLDITANAIQNTGEMIVDATVFNLHAETDINNAGLIQNTNRLNITATDLTNTAGAISSDIVSLQVSHQFINAGQLDNNEIVQGQVFAGQLDVQTNLAVNDLYSLIYADHVQINANQLTNKGGLVSNHITLTGDQFTNTGNMLSADATTDSLVVNFLTSVTNSGRISRNSDWSIVSNSVINQGRIESLGSGEINAQQIINSDAQKIATQANPAAIKVNLDNGLMSAKQLTITTNTFDNRYGLLIGDQQGLTAQSIDASVIQLNNQNGFIQSAAQDWSLNNIQLNNQNGTLWHSGSGAANLHLRGSLDNTNGSIISQGNLSLVLNDADSVLTNDAGLILANNLDLVTTKSIENLNQGSLIASNVILKSATLNNNGGVIEANAQDQALLTLTATQINNTNGGELRSAAKDWNMVLDSFNNDGGNIIHSGTGTLSLLSNTVFENKGNLVSAGNLVVNAIGLNNYGQVSANNQLSLITLSGITNQAEGAIAAGNSTELQANNQQITNQGYWYFGNHLTNSSSTSGSHLLNSGNLILGDGAQGADFNLTLASLNNQGTGAISYNNIGNFVINANTIVNDASLLALKGGLQFNLTGNNSNDGFTNNSNILAQRIQLTDSTASTSNSFTNNGVLQANQFVIIDADVQNTSSATLYGVGEAVFDLQNANIINKGTWINEASNWALSGRVNGSGNIFHKGDGLFSLALNNDSDLTGAYIETLGSVHLENGITGGESTFADANGQSITRRTTLISAKDMTLGGNTGFINSGANLATQQNLLVNTSINNTAGGLLKAVGQFSMVNNASFNLTNSGDIQANHFSILVDQFTNAGNWVALGTTPNSATQITANTIDNQHGFIQIDNATAELIASGNIHNQNGVIVNNTSGSVRLNAANIENQDGYISAAQLTLNAANQINNSNSGNTISQGIFTNQLSLKANTLNNTSGVININALAQTSYLHLIDVNSVNNQSGLIQLVHLDKNPATLDSLRITATAELDNQSGNIHLQNLQTSGNALINNPGNNNLTVTTAQLTTNTESRMTSDGIFGLNIQSAEGVKTDLTHHGQLQALNQFTLNAKNLANHGMIASGDNLTLNLDSFNLINSDSIFAKRALSIQAGNIENQQDIFADDNLDITAQGFSNVGALGSANVLTLNLSSDLTINAGESITAPGALSIITPNFIHNAGTIDSHNQLLLNTSTLTNTTTGKIIAGLGALKPDNTVEHSVFDIRDSINNAGLISVMGYLDINTPSFTNQGSIVAGGYRDANNNLQDFGGVTFDLNPADNTNTGSFINSGNNAVIYVRGDLTLNNAHSIVNQQNAQMIAKGNAEFNSNTLENNQSRIEAFGDVTITARDSIRNVTAEPALTSTVMFERTDGVFVRDEPGSVSFRVSSFYEKTTTIQQLSPVPESIIRAGNDLYLNTTNGLIENLYGSIFAGGNLEIDGATLNNQSVVANTIVNTRYFLRWEPTGCQTYCTPTISEQLDPDRPAVTTTTINSLGGYIHAASGNITGSLRDEVNNQLGNITTAAEKNPETPNNTIFTGELNDYINQLLPDELKKTFLTQSEIDTAQKKDAASVLAENLVNPEAGNTADGAGTGEQTSAFGGATGTQGSTETDLINQTDNEIADATEGIPALIAKAAEAVFKTNQWPLISFTVLPFNFNLHNLSGLFVLSQNPDSNYLIETRPEFTDINNLLGSDYLLEALGYDADKTIKRLGDAFFENQLIRDALIKETHSQYLGDVTNDYDLMQLLMDNAVTTARNLQLTIGVELTPEQCASLTQDMMWLVKRNVGGQEVLVPHLYLTSVSPEKMAASKSAMAAGGNLSLVTGSLNNQSSMFAGNHLLLSTRGNLQQDGRLFAQGDVRLLAGGTINNTGSMNANNHLLAVAQGDLFNTATGKINAAQDVLLQSTQGNVINQQGAINANNLTLDANKNVELTGSLSAQNNLSLIAGDDVLLTSTKVETDFSSKKVKSSSVQYTTTNLAAGGNITLEAGRDIQAEGSDFTAGGSINLQADRDVNLLALQNQSNYEYNAKRKKEIHNTTEHDVVNIQSGNNVTIDAGQDANLIGTNVAANDSVFIGAERDTNISAVVDSDYDYSYSKKKKSFGRSKTKIDETLVENVVGGTIDAGGNVLINAHANADGKVVTDASGKVNLLGVVINADENVVISGDEDVNVSGIQYNELDYHQRKKSGLGGLSKTDKGAAVADQLLENAVVSAGNNIHLISGNDLNVIAADVVADGDINMEAVDQLLIAAGDVKTKSEEWKNSSGYFTSGDIYNKKEHKAGDRLVTGQSSNVQAGGEINAEVGSAKIVGSNLAANESIHIAADSGNVDVTTYQAHVEQFSQDKEISVGLGDIVDKAKRPDQWVENKDGRAKLTFANATYDEIDNKTTITDNQASTIESNSNVTLIANAGEVNIQGSDVAADADGINGGRVGLVGVTGVNITEASNTYESQTKEIHGTAEMSVVVQHQAVEVANAIIAVDEAQKKLEQAKRDYKQYERNVDQLEEQLKQLESDVANKVPGVNYDDLLELRELVGDVKDDKEFYQTGVAMAAVNLTSSVTALAQQIAAAAASASTYGFNAGLQLDIDATKTNTTDKATTARASNISGNQIVIQTGTIDTNQQVDTTNTQTTIRGSNLIATQSQSDSGELLKSSIQIETGDLNILSSKNTTETTTKTEHGHITAQQTIYGAAGGPSMSGSYDQNKATDKSTTINNSQLNADSIELTTSNDLNIRGANVRANEHLEVDVAGDMNLESQQNRSNSRNTGFGISGGASLNGNNDPSGVNGGINNSNGMSVTRETVLTSLTSGGTANVNVKGNSQITGALIATTDENGKDLNQLHFDTGSLSTTDLRNTYQNNQASTGVSTNLAVGDSKANNNPREGQQIAEGANGKTLSAQTSNLTYSNTNENSASKTLATVGHGNITVGGIKLEEDGELTDAGKANNSPLISINRDTENTEKVLWDSSQSQTVDATLDHRLVSEDGRKEIKNDFVDSKEFGEDIARATGSVIEQENLNITDFWTALDNNTKATQLKNELLRNPENALILEGLKSQNPDDFAQAFAELGKMAQEKFGITSEEFGEIFLYDGGKTTSTSMASNVLLDTKGGLVLDKNNEEAGNIFINANSGVKTDMVNTLGHETIELLTFINQGNNDAMQEAQANVFGEQFSSRVNQAAGGDLNSTGGSQFSSNLNSSWSVTQGTLRANNVGNAAVDHRQLAGDELQFIQRNADTYAEKKGISLDQARKDLTQQALLMVDARWASQDHIKENSDAREFLLEQSQGESFSYPTMDGFVSTNYFTATEEQYNDPYLLASGAAFVEGILGSDRSSVDWSTPLISDPSLTGWLAKYATANGEMPIDDVTWSQIGNQVAGDAGLVKDKTINGVSNTWSVVTSLTLDQTLDGMATAGNFVWDKFTTDETNGVGMLGTFGGNCMESGITCSIPDSMLDTHGSSADKAFIDQLTGYTDSYTKHSTGKIYEGILDTLETAAYLTPAGYGRKGLADNLSMDSTPDIDFNDSDVLRLDDSFYEDDVVNGFDANINIDRERPDFYVGPLGPEQTLPATGYRYIRLFNDDGTVNKYALMTLDNDAAPVSFFGFEKYDSGIEAREAFQVRGPEHVTTLDPDPSWSDSRLRGDFDTLQLFENGEAQVRIPFKFGDTDPIELEPFTDAYPQYGEGGALQMHADGRKIEFDNLEILPESKLFDNTDELNLPITDPSRLLQQPEKSGAVKSIDDLNGSTIPTYDIPVIKVDASAAVKGTKEYDLLNDPTAREPFSYYDLGNGKSFTTNEFGFVDELTFTPEDVKVPRDSRQTAAGKKGESTDVGGHAQACTQGGTCDEYNLFPQDSNFNNSAYKVWYENIVRPALSDPNQTVGQATIRFTRIDPSSYRPDRLVVTYTINNQTKTVYFKNEPNQTPEVKDATK